MSRTAEEKVIGDDIGPNRGYRIAIGWDRRRCAVRMTDHDPGTRPDPGVEARGEDSAIAAATIEAARNGDASAWDRLVAQWARRVYAAAKSRLRDPDAAEEVTQSVMVTVFEHISTGRYVERGQFESWLFRIAMNRLRDDARARKRHATHELGDAAEGLASGPPEEHEGTDGLRAALDGLPPADREVIELRHRADMSFKQIAEMLDQPLGTVLARHHRALRKLRTVLEAAEARESTA